MKQDRIARIEKFLETLPPVDWEPYDNWDDYAAYPIDEGYSTVDSSNSGDVHSHGIAMGEWIVRKEIEKILGGD